MAVLDVWPNLIQNEGNDVRFHGQEEHVAPTDCLFVASRHVHPHFLQKKKKNREIGGDEKKMLRGLKKSQTGVITTTQHGSLGQAHACTHPGSHGCFHFTSPSRSKAQTHLLTLSPVTVGRSVSGELAVILCVAITPVEGNRRKWTVRYEDIKDGNDNCKIRLY